MNLSSPTLFVSGVEPLRGTGPHIGSPRGLRR